MSKVVVKTPRVKCAQTKKLFFGVFAFSFMIPYRQIVDDAHRKYMKTSIWVSNKLNEYHNYHKVRKVETARILSEVFENEHCPPDLEYRTHKAGVIFYTSDEQKFNDFVNNNEDVSRISKPAVPLSVLNDLSSNTIVRETLFFNKYPIKITFKWSRGNNIDEMISQAFEEDDKVRYRPARRVKVLYAADEMTLVKVRLLLHEHIEVVQKIKTISECENI